MKLNKKIKAYTLSEMIIVLILTSIVVGLAFSVLGLVQKHMTAIQSNYGRNLELNRLESILWMDFNRYPNITYNSIQNELKFASEIDSIRYKFTDKHIIRKQDTFDLFFQNKQFYFNGELIQEQNIDAIKLEASEKFQYQSLFIFKSNDANTFMN
ncbi:PulJ/GspJ family protein [Psychroserpens sp.]|uniref:PulJ/GspJ family protein n=1 Tax=Psychroserpens sp. TaxID=2020870 RepID=UPI002B270392|nr:prepilin-type N-terminal cleavage/methylation domain-containing protein [Psychroserpens sp.]